MAEQCRWCKGTGVILGFAWEQYPCECREPAKPLGDHVLPPGWQVDPVTRGGVQPIGCDWSVGTPWPREKWPAIARWVEANYPALMKIQAVQDGRLFWIKNGCEAALQKAIPK